MSTLPKIDYPILNIKISSLKKEFMFRPFLVKEEKLLLMAKESGNSIDIFIAIKQIVQNCCLDKKFDIDSIPIFDLEYIFLKLRSFSIDNNVKISYKDEEDGKVYEFDVNLEDVKVETPKKVDNVVKINEKVGIIMKYPSASLYSDEEFLTTEKDHLFELILKCIDKIYNEDEVFEAKNFSKAEIVEFVENLNIKVFEKIHEFLMSMPKIQYIIKYKNSSGKEKKIVLGSLNDFFSWR